MYEVCTYILRSLELKFNFNNTLSIVECEIACMQNIHNNIYYCVYKFKIY